MSNTVTSSTSSTSNLPQQESCTNENDAISAHEAYRSDLDSRVYNYVCSLGLTCHTSM
ncbi:hypothetical protein AB751O23_AF_00010, partial [Chlamydiales bacterium SCGC AB-751-O23]